MSALEEAPKLARLGSRIAVLIGWRIPVEPIIAAGLTPVTIVPDLAIATPDADVLLSADESLEIRALVQTIVAGQLGFADIILFAPPFARVSAMMEELRRGDLVPQSIPPTYYFELPIQQGEHNRVFAVERVNGFARRIAAAAGLGNAVPEDRLEDSIAATNKVRRAAAALGATRRGARPISGTDYMEAMVAGDWLAPDTHAARLEKLTLTSRSPTNAARMLVVSSSVLAGSSLHSLIEQEGGLVVGEDDIYMDPVSPKAKSASEAALRWMQSRASTSVIPLLSDRRRRRFADAGITAHWKTSPYMPWSFTPNCRSGDGMCLR